jgi:hypothetical protein
MSLDDGGPLKPGGERVRQLGGQHPASQMVQGDAIVLVNEGASAHGEPDMVDRYPAAASLQVCVLRQSERRSRYGGRSAHAGLLGEGCASPESHGNLSTDAAPAGLRGPG